ncbi:MAG: septum formation inhibitor Maf [Bryobacteraceae bacterium]|nr:septum formation inhibitor Maf [Bryobacteraceae bacterium]
MTHPRRLVLASASPRRKEILESAGIPFVRRAVDISEEPFPRETAGEHVRRLAETKAAAAACEDGEVVLGADTVVVVDGEILGKPADARDAARMLRALAGREHEVVTGICLKTGSRSVTDEERTRVRFVPLSDDEIAAYVASGEPMDKAGAYGIQGAASKFIDRVEGCYFNVVGLPVARVYRWLKELGFRAGPLGGQTGAAG